MAQDPYRNRGAFEREKPERSANLGFQGQLGHRNKDPLIDSYDTDFPEPGENPEHSGEAVMTTQKNPKRHPEKNKARVHKEVGKVEIEIEETYDAEVDQDPGESQKENQNQQKDDPLAA
jgi:hypothetical protein